MRVDDVSLLVVVTHRALYLESGVVEVRCGGTARAVGIRATTRRNEPLRPVELRPVLPSVEEHNLAGQAVEPHHTVAGELRIGAEPVGLRAHFQAFARLSAEERSEEHTSELQSLMRISYAGFCLKKKTLTQKSIQPYTIS